MTIVSYYLFSRVSLLLRRAEAQSWDVLSNSYEWPVYVLATLFLLRVMLDSSISLIVTTIR